jgi:hypothetical protein
LHNVLRAVLRYDVCYETFCSSFALIAADASAPLLTLPFELLFRALRDGQISVRRRYEEHYWSLGRGAGEEFSACACAAQAPDVLIWPQLRQWAAETTRAGLLAAASRAGDSDTASAHRHAEDSGDQTLLAGSTAAASVAIVEPACTDIEAEVAALLDRFRPPNTLFNRDWRNLVLGDDDPAMSAHARLLRGLLHVQLSESDL